MNDLDILNQQAIDAAIAQRWEEAVTLNKKILTADPHKLEPHLRLGFAYLQLEDMKLAKRFYQKALKIQAKNPVALENLERISILEGSTTKNPIKTKATLSPSLFLEVPGKTKSVSLVNLGQKNHLAELDIGEAVLLKTKKRKIEVRTTDGDYIGYLPDDLSKRLIFFMDAKSEYSAYVKEASQSRVVIFIREDKKGARVAHHSSFPTNINFDLTTRDVDEEHEGEEAGIEEDEWSKMVSSTENEEEPVKVYQPEEDEEE